MQNISFKSIAADFGPLLQNKEKCKKFFELIKTIAIVFKMKFVDSLFLDNIYML